MNHVWRKIKNTFITVFQFAKSDAYLFKLVENLKEAQEKQTPLPFVIKSSNDKGFMVKIGGMYAFLDYRYMPWNYNTLQDWPVVSPHLTGKNFFGKVIHISGTKRPYWIHISAKVHRFKPKELTLYEEYETVIVHKSKHGLFVDAGFHFNWSFGSFFGLIHTSAFWDIDDYEQAREGQIISTYFHGFTKEGKLIFGCPDFQGEWRTGELDALIGTVQKETVKINGEGKKEFFVNDTYKATLPISKAYYPKSQFDTVKDFKEGLNNGDVFEAEIFKISKARHFVVRLVLDDTNTGGNNLA